MFGDPLFHSSHFFFRFICFHNYKIWCMIRFTNKMILEIISLFILWYSRNTGNFFYCLIFCYITHLQVIVNQELFDALDIQIFPVIICLSCTQNLPYNNYGTNSYPKWGHHLIRWKWSTTNIFTGKRTHMHTHTCTVPCTHAYTLIHTHFHAWMHACTRAHAHTHMRTCTHAHAHTHTHTHTSQVKS